MAAGAACGGGVGGGGERFNLLSTLRNDFENQNFKMIEEVVQHDQKILDGIYLLMQF